MPTRLQGPWHMAAAAGPLSRAVPVVAIGGDLVLWHGKSIVRANAKALLPSVTLRLPGRKPDILAVARTAARLWLLSTPNDTGDATILLAVDTTSWRFTERIRLPRSVHSSALTAAQGEVYVGSARRIGVVDARGRHGVDRWIDLPRPFDSVVAMSVSPNGRSLYASVAHRHDLVFPQLVVLDPHTGAVRAGPTDFEDSVGALTATDTGVWMQSGGPHLDALAFHRRSALTMTAPESATTAAGGGFYTTTALRRDTAWISGTSEIACANPSTGRRRAAAAVGSPHHDAANLSRLTPTANGLYGYYLADAGPSGYLVRLTPPARCLPAKTKQARALDPEVYPQPIRDHGPAQNQP